MKLKYVLLTGILAPGLLILPTPTVAAPGSDMVVAQNCPPPKKIINGQCVVPPPPPAAVKPATPPKAVQPAPPRPNVAQPPTQPPGQPPRREFRQVNPPGGQQQQQQGQKPISPAQKQIKPVQTQPVIQPQGQQQGQPPIKQVNPQVAPLKPGQNQPAAVQPLGKPPLQQAVPQIAPAPTATPTNVRKLDDFRGLRKETRQGNSVIIQEPGRTIIRDGNRFVIQRNEASGRFGLNARNVLTERQGANTATIIERPNGTRIVNLTDTNGRLLRRSRRDASGREVVLIDNMRRGGVVAGVAVGAAAVAGLVILHMRPPAIHIPRERYIVEAEGADQRLIYETLMAPPVEILERDYSLDEIRYNVELRDRMPRIDIDTITFDFASWEVTPDQAQRLQFIADGLQQAIQENPGEVFLIEGHTDAVGSDIDNLSLSDRRAESVAQVLTEQFNIPPENLTTQGYGKQYLKIPTPEPERRNRRVTIRRITPLLNGPVAQNRR
jgi:outer membrane protein OmpA-like peptidoglycan-associated protein